MGQRCPSFMKIRVYDLMNGDPSYKLSVSSLLAEARGAPFRLLQLRGENWIKAAVLQRASAMAAETEGIALLSMYGDDEEEEEAAVAAEEEKTAASAPVEDDDVEDSDENLKDNQNKSNQPPQHVPDKSPQPFNSPSLLQPLEGAEIKTLRSPFPHQTPTPQPPASRSQLSSPLSPTSPSPPAAPVPPSAMLEYPDGQIARRSALVIVDYAQDETAMSPEAEMLEIEVYGRVIFGAELHVSDGNIEGTAAVTSQSLTPPSQQDSLPPFDVYEQSKFEASMAMEFTGTESEVAEVKPPTVSTEMQIDKPMQNFLPSTATTRCPEELQEKINKFLAYKRAGKSFNADLRNRKDYRNPNFLQHAVSYQDIDEIGTCFSKEVFDPHGYDKSDYYDEIEADLKRELERREQERKKSQKIDLASGCTQPGGIAQALKTNAHIPAAGISSILGSSLPPNSTTGDASRDSRTNKKSKWDKVDGDAKISLPSGGHDNPPSASVHASHLSAANAGTGYSAFAQLKRREAEEKKSSERKFDKRS
ncbi:hypothetical protein IEQ34_003780 [Dendrobium chrysotoxum]|uniref:SAP30-binding protein n=1 Tax=Dendrobium chrysotoxum TaxID=161865 RepID=A0AAV7HCE3_DENCH|nr:hypothetical protein IEQ34_003780 [Dendrobium chrysotoxum]